MVGDAWPDAQPYRTGSSDPMPFSRYPFAVAHPWFSPEIRREISVV
jgi:hypothetical protein